MTTLDANGSLSGMTEDKDLLLLQRGRLFEESRKIARELAALQERLREEDSKRSFNLLDIRIRHTKRVRLFRRRLRKMWLALLREQWASYRDYKACLKERHRQAVSEVEAEYALTVEPITGATRSLQRRLQALDNDLERVNDEIAKFQQQYEMRQIYSAAEDRPLTRSAHKQAPSRKLRLRRTVATVIVLALVAGVVGVVWSNLPSGHRSVAQAPVVQGVLDAPDQSGQGSQATQAATSAAPMQNQAAAATTPKSKPATKTVAPTAKSTAMTRDQAIAQFNAEDNQMPAWAPPTVKFWAADVQKAAADPRVVAVVDGKKVNILQGVLTDDGQWHNGREDLLYVMMLLSGGNPDNGPIALDGDTSRQLAAETGLNPLLASDPHQLSYDNLVFAGRHLNDIAGAILTNTCVAKLINNNAAPSSYLDKRLIASWYGQAYDDSCHLAVSTTGQIPGKQLSALVNLYQDWRSSTSAQWQELQNEVPMKQLLQQAKTAEAALKPLPTT